jgi:hypothetical protein
MHRLRRYEVCVQDDERSHEATAITRRGLQMKYNRSVLNAWIYIVDTYIHDYENARKDKAFQTFIGNLGYYYPDEWEKVAEILEKQVEKSRKGKR